MAISSVPTQLSAESTIETTIELRWNAPDDDGGLPITGYFIERNRNESGFVTLVANTGNSNTKYTDSTLTARDNAAYRVSAINGSGTSPTSDTASATTTTSEAQTIKELLFNNWSLTGELSKTVVGDMTEPIHFFDRQQIPGNKKTKAVTVQKINELGNENIIEHPKFSEQSDTFEVTCLLQITDSADDEFSKWVDLVQQMTSEVTRILKTKYSPSTGTGEFFKTDLGWTKGNTFESDDAELRRILRFTLTRLIANQEEVFLGYDGILVFDISNTDAIDPPNPTTDYIFLQVDNVEIEEGYVQRVI
jgi:hypothetical protein